MIGVRKLMPQNKIPSHIASSLLIPIIFIIALMVATAGTFIFNFFYTPTFIDFTVFIVGLFSFVICLTVADFVSRRIGFNVSNDKKLTALQVNSIWLCLVGILLSLGTWIQIGLSPKPSIRVPIIIVTVVQIILYIVACTFVFISSDPVRKKVWTPLVFVLALTLPSVIIYTFAQLG
jgi:hypothetical protein